MEIHQILVSADPGDAVTNAALGNRDLLRRVGRSEIFARYIHSDLAGDVLPLDEYPREPSAQQGQNLLIYHASIGEPAVVAFLLGRKERLVLVYHNITPARYYATVDPAFAQLLAGGRVELAVLRDRVVLALADSAYNAAELEELGYRDVRVAPLVVEADRLRRIDPKPSTVADLEGWLGGPLVIFVGRIVPHKRPDLLVQAYHILVTHLLPDAHLALLGPYRTDHYYVALETFVRELNLQQARIFGRVPDEDLVALFRAASVFVTLSEHEGFCVPLLEAMAFDLPVVARDFAAISETLGGAGLLLPAEDDPVLVAEALAQVLTDETLRHSMVAGGARRLKAFHPDDARVTFLRHLTDVA